MSTTDSKATDPKATDSKATDSKATDSMANLSPSSPAFFASLLGMLVGAFMILFGAYLLVKGGKPLPLGIAVVCVGAMQCATGFYTIKRIRVAWAFAISINATSFLVFLFSSARIRDAAEVHFLAAMIPALAFGLIVLLYAVHTEEF
jgi:hypothetical protein